VVGLVGVWLKNPIVLPSLVGLASLSLVSSAVLLLPRMSLNQYSDQSVAGDQATQCRSLMATVVDARQVGNGFYARKATALGRLSLSDGRLQTLRSQFVSTFQGLDAAQRRGDRASINRLNRQASQSLSELNRYCLR
jgi:hypothetical protein